MKEKKNSQTGDICMKYTYNKEYLMRDEKPWFPVMGEFHYSRYRDDLWEESLRKMKAGGVTVVATYAFWIHHEEQESVYDFTGCRNVGKFLAICRNWIFRCSCGSDHGAMEKCETVDFRTGCWKSRSRFAAMIRRILRWRDGTGRRCISR